ncbi:uncharacterized protein UV8b_00093 [Ustilaginoidea virens]|uniref:Uncharacterized protein n=1 Tax=Ustilaginoidea virens TaxID=1159556 RepID=A0A8E5HIG5_USTVR|nr:uncharacterized protein UV8b_00093 [Ustilaginoidea virens]QUC15852.1 hypothetical protein UV8b_00093 [Ustilaginoidea virens]
MGGRAFASRDKPLFTPRMPPPVYQHVKARCHDILRQRYMCVASPIEAPGKQDHGDVDILVAWPWQQGLDTARQLEHIAASLGATDVIAGGASTFNLAIPWPPGLPGGGDDDDDETDPPRHVQIDVRICATLEELQWILFKHAHGDLWSIVGSTIRPYGLTVDDAALWLRIPEVEAFDKARASVFLTSEPAEVLRFLGLPLGEHWDGPFASPRDMFAYAARCRVFRVPPPGPPDRDSLQPTDRKRMNKRPAFRAWIDDFIPECRRRQLFLREPPPPPPPSRAEIAREAMALFRVEAEFVARRKEMLLQRQRQVVLRDLVKGAIPQPDHNKDGGGGRAAAAAAAAAAALFRGCQIRALNKIITQGDTGYGVVPDEELRDAEGFFVMDRVRGFIERRKDEVGRAAWEKHQQQYAEMRARKKE